MNTTEHGFNIYKRYLAINLHFEGDYDYSAFGPLERIRQETYEKNNACWTIEKFAKKYPNIEDATLYLAVNRFAHPKDKWIQTMFANPQSPKTYIEFQKRRDARVYWFRQDALTYKNTGNTEIIIENIFKKELAPDTLICYNLLKNKTLFDSITRKLFPNDDLIWPFRKKRLEKLTPFLNISSEELAEMKILS